MDQELADGRSLSIFGKLVGSERSVWVTVAITLSLLLLPLGAAALDGLLVDFFVKGYWQSIYLPTAVILYILFVGPILTRIERKVVESFRPLVRTDDHTFQQVVARASRTNPIIEAIAFGAGGALGATIGLTSVESTSGMLWLELWVLLSGIVMFGMVGWAVYAAVSSTRLTSALHHLPLCIDIFDPKPFEPIGRQSLALSLVFVGGILLSMVFNVGSLSILAWQNLVVYLALALVVVLVFFLNMRETHRLLSTAKNKELEAVQKNVVAASRTLMERIGSGEPTGSLGAEINALVVYEQRIRGTRTWPYDTAMLRTLFFSLVIPAALELAKLIFGRMFR